MKTKVIDKTFVKEYDHSYFLFNAFTNCTLEISKVDVPNLQQYLDKEMNNLLAEGVFCPSETSYYELADFFIKRDTTNTENLTITDAATFDCNLRCVYCMQQNTNQRCELIPPKQRIKIWMQVMSLLNSSSLSVCLFGGEPFFYKHYVNEMLETAKSVGLNLKDIFAVTNGTLIDRSMLDIINRYGISSLQITLDGPKEVHDNRRYNHNKEGSFDLIIENIKGILNETDSEIYINTVIDKTNYNSYLELIDILGATFGKHIYGDSPRIIFNLGNECDPLNGCDFTLENKMHSDDEIVQYYSLLESLFHKGVAVSGLLPSASCLRDNFREIIVGPDGNLYNCISGIGIPDFLICSSEELFNSPASSLAKIAASHKSIKNNACRKCEYYGMCNGGCYYELVIGRKKSVCQKNTFNACIDKIMDLLVQTEEIAPDIYRLKPDIKLDELTFRITNDMCDYQTQ